MLHTDELITCPIFAEPGNLHFEVHCEDCDARRLARLNLGQVEGRYQQGRFTQEAFEAYMFVWATLSPARSRAEWRELPQDADVRRIARKLLVIRNFAVPAELVDARPIDPIRAVGDVPTEQAA
ncbi:hypothetical protein [Streptomyces sp. NPDC093598]|uniref:hypothetical protein n=1 Tax=Streptomyces sp. NPDC093598 TaxID=3366046 RepID=UPI00381E44F8